MHSKHHPELTSGRHTSYWLYEELHGLRFAPFRQYMQTDVVVVGGGIAGLTVAYCLLKSGKQVTLVEDGFIASGETGHTTAHLVNALDDRYYELERLFGAENLKLIADSHTKAINMIEEIVKEENIDCDFKRVDGYLFLHPSDTRESLDKELEATKKAGLDVELIDHIPQLENEHRHPCIRFKNQAQFHPLKYMLGLAKAVTRLGGYIYTETRAKEINESGIVTEERFRVDAKHVVVATNSPVNNKYAIHMKQYPYRTYVIGARIRKGSVEPALWWDTGDMNANSSIPPYHYARIQELEEDPDYDLLICGGQDHAVGLADAENIPEENRYKLLEEWAVKRFSLKDVVYRWSGEVFEPMDGLAFIGRNPMDKDNVYVVTGDSGTGLTHAQIAGMLITDLVNGKENPWEKLYDPSRVNLKAAGTFFKEFAGGLFQYLKNKPDTDPDQISDLKQDEGKVLKWNNKTCGIYKSENNQLHIVDATCTHLGCTVKWNNDEKSWDCPCHGSRFTVEGVVINGPANENLAYHTENPDIQ